MSFGRRRGLIPFACHDLSTWPVPDINVLGAEAKAYYLRRRTSVEMYSQGIDFAAITAATDFCGAEVRRTLKRCLSAGPDGEILGFYACLSRYRAKRYTRSADVDHALGDGSGGCSGALTQLFERFPDVEVLVQELYLGKSSRTRIAETRTPIVAVHNEFKKMLRQLQLTDAHWPFNTMNCGYRSIARYCKQLGLANSQRAALGRSGIEAMRRGAVGKGIAPIVPCLRPYSSVQLDFHKVDAASIIVLTNEFGVEIEVPLSRWHIGLAVEEYSGAVIGAYVALEKTPSGDGTLEVVDSVLRADEPDQADISSGPAKLANTLLRQLMPELTYQCFSVLKVDNGKSNIAHDVVNNIMDVVGCAVNFGPAYGWWRRDLIEKIFGQLTAKGLQRAPSTHGIGPGDVRITSPNKKAIQFRILLTDLIAILYKEIRNHNVRPTERLQWCSPLDCIRAAHAHERSGFMLQPLPASTQDRNLLLQHMEEVTVRGSVRGNVRPYFIVDRWRYTSQTLANSFHLIGQKLLIYTDRRRCRIVYATVIESGESLGLMSPNSWRNRSDCSWRDRKLFNRTGMSQRETAIFDDPVEELKREKARAISKRSISKKNQSSSDALAISKLVAADRADKSGQPKTAARAQQIDAPLAAEAPTQAEDPFGLGAMPALRPIARRR